LQLHTHEGTRLILNHDSDLSQAFQFQVVAGTDKTTELYATRENNGALRIF
jgi:hypothetical protein